MSSLRNVSTAAAFEAATAAIEGIKGGRREIPYLAGAAKFRKQVGQI